MKKKFFSKLLMVALVATVGAFSSCKDYDDDIADVRNTINQTAKDLQTEYTNKISEVSSKVDKLQTSYDALSAALTEANTKLTALINSRFSEAVETAKAYSDANLVKAKDAAAAAESSAKAYADIQRVEAEKAALAAAQKEVAAAKAELQEALNKATETIAKQGQSIEALTKSCAGLDAAVKAAQARADEAYALADKANTLATQNKTALEKAASDIAALQTSLANLDGKVADKAEVTKIQSELNALKDQVDKNVVSLSDYNTAITKLTSDLGALKDDLAKQVGVLGESIGAVKLIADGNVAKINGITDQLSSLKEDNTKAHEQIIASINSLAQTVESNKSAAAEALKAAIDGVMAELGAAKTLIENNDAAIRALVDTKAGELKALIDGNTAAIVKNAQDIQKNAETQKAENTLMNNAIVKNAQDIVAQGKDITKLDDAVKALKTALGDDTAATLKAYAESIAKSEALQAKLDAQGYSDAQDAAQNLTIMEAIKQQAAQDKKAWESAISLAIENLVTTYKLASLDEYIKQTAAAAQSAAEQNAADKAQQIANDALDKANKYTDKLAQTLKDNYTTTTDMQTAIENAKKAAISQAYLDVLNTLLRDYDAWYSMNNENKMNLELTPTIIELTKAAVEKYGLTKENAQSIIDATIEAGLTKPEGTGTYDKDGNEIMTEPGVIMAEILAAADALQQEFTEKFNGIDLRLKPIEQFLGATLGEGEAFKASVNAIIATSATASDVAALKKQIAGTEASGLLTKINDAAAQAAQNAADVQKVMTTINNINGMFTSLFGGEEATSNVDETALKTFEENIKALVERINGIKEITDNLDQKVMESVNKNLGATLQSMITSINLYANIHQATSDTYYGDNKGDEVKWYKGYIGLDHELKFAYTVEQGKPDMDVWSYPENYEMRGFYELPEGVKGVQFEKGMFRTYDDAILVRVSPVNADLAAVKDKIALINSLGNNIVADGIVEVTDVQRFEESGNGPITRAYGDNKLNTGLWLIKFKLVEGKIASDFKDAAFVTADKDGNYKKQIVYAVAVKNTDFKAEKDEEGNAVDDGIDRYVVSEFDLTLAQAGVSNSYDFYVNETPIAEIHNRYVRTDEAETGGTNWSDDKKTYPASFSYELTWNTLGCYDWAKALESSIEDPDKRQLIHDYYCCNECDLPNDDDEFCAPHLGATFVKWNADLELGKCEETVNAVDRAGHSITEGNRNTSGEDNRHLKAILEVDDKYLVDAKTEGGALAGEEGNWWKIKIDFDDNNDCDEYTKIRAFYVTLDEDFSKESGTSEINAWTSYIYKNVAYYYVEGKTTNPTTGVQTWKPSKLGQTITVQEGNHGVIYIKDANNVRGDIIGFRVHAVNVDGTFTDPDGRAFYVRFGKELTHHSLDFIVEPEDEDVDAKAVQEGNPNPIYTFNTDVENGNMRFFNIAAYDEGYIPEEDYEYVYTWRGDDNIIRGYGGDESVAAYWAVDGSISDFVDKDGKDASTLPGVTKELMKQYFSPESFFTFDFSKNPEATAEDNEKNDWKAQTNTPVWPNRTANSVRVTAKAKNGNKSNFDRLIDGHTYKLTLTIYRKDRTIGSAENVGRKIVNTIDINITKKMPESLPSDFYVNSGSGLISTDGTLQFYLRPLVDADIPALTAQNANQNGGQAAGTTVPGRQTYNDGGDAYGVTDPWKITWNDFDLTKEFTTDKDEDGNDIDPIQHTYRWGVDVRPWTFEEIFHGLFKVNNVDPNAPKSELDENYLFIFSGSGDFAAATNAINRTKEPLTEAAADEAEKNNDAYAAFKAYAASKVNNGTLEHGQSGYNLPAIHWSHLNQSKQVKANYIYRGISATLNEDGNAFVKPAAEKESIKGLTTAVYNKDFMLPEAVDVKVGKKDGKMDPNGTALKAKYNCAFEKFVKGYKDMEVGTEKTFEYGQNVYISLFEDADIDVDADQFITAGDAKAYFDSKFDSWTINNKKVKLSYLLQSGYLKVDSTTIKIELGSGYDLYDYYDKEYLATDATGTKPTPAESMTGLTHLYLRCHATDEGLPALNKDYTGLKASYVVSDVWGHKAKITVKGAKINKPKNMPSARQAR